MKEMYNEDYFERGVELGISGYMNYRWLPELTIPMCARIIEHLDITEEDSILDFGCAKGYTVKGFRLLRRKAFGVDISPYAIDNVHEDVKSFCWLIEENQEIPIRASTRDKWDWVISKDVLEHMPTLTFLDNVLVKLRKVASKMFIVVPLAEHGKFVAPPNELDTTHNIRLNLAQWMDRFIAAGFQVEEATYRVKGIKEDYAEWPQGHGFFTLR